MRSFLSILITFLASQSLFAQFNADNLYGSWVKTNLTYKDGGDLPDENVLKSTYFKYTFTAPDQLNISQLYYENGSQFIFEILNNDILVRTSGGSIINQLHIVELTHNRMVLQAPGRLGFDDPTALKYTFTREHIFQNSLSLNPADIYTVVRGDTIYRECQKVYANFKGDGFQKYLYANSFDDTGDGVSRVAHLAATFIVSKTGIADSLVIREGINAHFDKTFIKAFNRAKKSWKPAYLNGKPVAVEMHTELNYGAYDSSVSAIEYTDKANQAFKKKDYQAALYFYDEALKNHAADPENLYYRGICKQKLGNQAGACEDWRKIKALGGNEGDELLAKYCH